MFGVGGVREGRVVQERRVFTKGFLLKNEAVFKICRDGILLKNVVLRIVSFVFVYWSCLLYTSPSPRDKRQSRMPSSA